MNKLRYILILLFSMSEIVLLTSGLTDEQEEVCHLGPMPANARVYCMAFMPSFTYSWSRGRCESYIYGGCGKTRNLFHTFKNCEDFCGGATEACDSSACSEEMQTKRDAGCFPSHVDDADGPCCPAHYYCPLKMLLRPTTQDQES